MRYLVSIKPIEPTLITPIHNISIPTEMSQSFFLFPYNPKIDEIIYGTVSRSMIAEISEKVLLILLDELVEK